MGLMTIQFAEPAPQPIHDLAADAEYWARQVAACALMDEIAALLGVDHGLVWQALCSVPDNMLCLLDSPQGWTALAGYAAAELGIAPRDFMPSVH
jgi:hypothetical protein